MYCNLPRRHRKRYASFAFLLILTGAFARPANASPWAEVGDAQLRSDIELLAAARMVDGITTHWPLPWLGLRRALLENKDALTKEPANVQAAAARVLAAAGTQLESHRLKTSATVDIASTPSVVYGFDGLGRGKAEAQISGEMIFDTTAIRISAGGELSDWSKGGQGKFKPDGSYLAQKIGGAVVYAGWLSHWWGPGWVSALSLSNNARPFPQIGIERLDTSAFETPVLSWFGPWQMEFLVGLLDGPRIANNTLYSGLRFTFNPLPGLEIGLARTEEFCGDGHPCKPIAYYFNFANDPAHPNHVNDQGDIDVHYSGMAWGTAYELYTQVMNEDSDPIAHSGTSHLFGASVWLPLGDRTLRLTTEYTDSIATQNIFSFGREIYGGTGYAYNNYDYVDGMRYRGRTLGFSLDSNSRLASLQASWINRHGWTYTLSYHHARISTPQTAPGANIVTTSPVTVNLGEARVSIPRRWGTIDIAGRLQDDQPRPNRGFEASIETALTINL